MASIFTKDDKFVEKPKRNSFDLSFQNNLSLKFGKLVPCFCQEVLPGDSFKIKPTFGLRFLPQVFPVQTRMKAHMHFFYVRNRTLWKDWMDFIGKTKSGLVPPYLKSSNGDTYQAESDPNYYESSIYDYMGLPVTVDCETPVSNYSLMSSSGNVRKVKILEGKILDLIDTGVSFVGLSQEDVESGKSFVATSVTGSKTINYREYKRPIVISKAGGYWAETFRVDAKAPENSATYLLCKCDDESTTLTNQLCYIRINTNVVGSSNMVNVRQKVYLPLNEKFVYIREVIGCFSTFIDNNNGSPQDYYVSIIVNPTLNRNYPFNGLSANCLPYGEGEWQYRINALPFRAYEAIYNSFYRNAENNPFKIDGVPEYNRYVKSIDGGAQSTSDFKLFNRNWEDDAFTTAVPTPQQGDAPRVGLTGSPNEPVILHYQDDNDNIGQLHLTVNSEGHVVMLEHGNDAPPTLVNGLNDMINFGITINDLRNINAFTLWKEKNVRRGYKYPDQMMSHYGVSIEYNELLMPEFIGGVSRDVTVNQISQTVETSTGNLGDMAGQAYVVGDGHAISKYCDEHGYIIGILSVVPVPNYSQLIPKHFFKHDAFDYFFPEFGKIGMQPISCKEISATAAWLQHKGDETFGYQRAWYDYLANVDQVHGKFNSDFYDFLIQRKFGNVPELGADFTTIKSEDLNNIFYVDDNEDKILGQIYFDVKAIRPIPLFGIPSLE